LYLSSNRWSYNWKGNKRWMGNNNCTTFHLSVWASYVSLNTLPCLACDTKYSLLLSYSYNTAATKTEFSLPYSKKPASSPYLDPTESNLHPNPSSKIQSDLSIWSSECLFPLISHQNLVHLSFFFNACHMPRPPHYLWLDLPNDTWG
jgi:hypothetical protein